MSENIDKNGAEDLANAIIRQAVHDYRRAAKILRKHPNNADAQNTQKEVADFLRSPWCEILTMLNGELFLKRLIKEAA